MYLRDELDADQPITLIPLRFNNRQIYIYRNSKCFSSFISLSLSRVSGFAFFVFTDISLDSRSRSLRFRSAKNVKKRIALFFFTVRAFEDLFSFSVIFFSVFELSYNQHSVITLTHIVDREMQKVKPSV
ncbi:hypothetical protein LWI29_013633 [Acer saccharum]|uniref:Uncharacterized protein n=1 Tax=Acer saccharum TaxID=4024 RepID=A0AA39ST66_ACESA|nr:hypothetical protein LWI29_013633 [Acer saccharum]